MGTGKRSQRSDMMRYSVRTTYHSSISDSSTLKIEEGSGVMVQYGGRLYLFTAGHCFRTGDTNRLTLEAKTEGGELSTLKIKRLIHHTCENPEDHTKLDIGIVEVDPPMNKLPERELKLGSLRDTEDDEKFFAYGYPGKDRSGLECTFTPNCDDTWKLNYESLGRDGDDVVLMKGYSGAGIIDIYEDKCICVGILRGFHDNVNAYNKLVVTPSVVYESFLPDGKSRVRNDSSVEYQVPVDYFPRTCRGFTEIAINHTLWGIDKNTATLCDYLMGNIDNFSSRHILLAGAAQTGKSYEMRKLAADLSQSGHRVKLMDLKNTINLRKTVQDMGEEGFLLLDGLDEVKIKEMPDVADSIKCLARDYPAIRVVVSCRENFISFMEDDLFGAVVLEDFDMDDIREYLKRSGVNIDEIYPLLEQNNLLVLCSTPFNLNTIVEIGRGANGGFVLPKSMVSVYEEFVGRLYKAEADKPTTLSFADQQQCFRLLRQIAYRMVREEVYELPKEKILHIVGDEKGLDLILRNAVIRVKGDFYSFTSNTVREFLVAQLLTEHDILDVKRKVCEQGTERIRLKFRESVKWWLNHESSTKSLPDDVISWICGKENDPRLLLGCRPDSIGEERRLEIVKDILESRRCRGSFYNAYYTGDFRNLFRFAYSPLFVDYVITELDGLNQSGADPHTDANTAAHLYNLLCLVSYLPWDKLVDTKAKVLKEKLLTSLKTFKDWSSGFSLLYWVIVDSTLYHDTDLVERIMEIAGSCDNHDVLSAICAIVYKGGMADKYVPFLLHAEEEITDKGTLLVPRDNLYAAVGSLREKGNVLMMLGRIQDNSFTKRNFHGEEDYKRMVKNLLLTLFKFEEGASVFKNIFDSFYPYDSTEVYDKYGLIDIFDEVRSEKGFEDEDLACRVFKLVNPYYRSPEEEKQLQEKREKELHTLEDYDAFKREVNKILAAYEIADPHVRQDVCNLAAISGADQYAQQFAIRHSDWSRFDPDRVSAALEDREEVELFQFDQFVRIYTNRISPVKLSEKSVEFIKRKAHDLLTKEWAEGIGKRYSYLKDAMKLLVRGEISLSQDELIKLLPYSFEEFDDGQGKMRSVMEVIIQNVNRESLIGHLMKYLADHGRMTTPNHKGILDYLMRNGDREVREMLYNRMIGVHESAESFFLLDAFLSDEGYKDRIKSDYERFSEYDRMKISDALGEEGLFLLEQSWQSFDGMARISALQKLLRGGSLEALSYFDKHYEELEDIVYLAIFNYDNPAALDCLFRLLGKVKGKSFEFLSAQRSLESSIGKIAEQSDSLCEEVILRIKDAFKDDNPYLLQFIDICTIRRLQAKDIEDLLSLDS